MTSNDSAASQDASMEGDADGTSWLTWAAAALVVAIVLLGINRDLLRGLVSPTWDAFDFFAPYYLLVGDYARAGQFLLWNPFVHGGSPDYIEPQVGAFSPLVLLFGLVGGGGRHTFELYWLTIWFGGGAGVLLLGRRLGAPWWGGLVAALGFVFSGVYTGNAQHTATLASTSFLPLVLWRVEAALGDRALRPAAEAGALWGLSALAGYPGLVILDAGFVALWCLGRCAWRDRPQSPTRPDRRVTATWAVVVLALMATVGIVVLAPTFVAFLLEGRGFSERSGPLAREVAISYNALHPAGLITIASPFLALADIYGATDISLRSIYLGVVTPLLAAFALRGGRRTPFAWWLLLVAVVFLMTATGSALPLRGWLYDLVPPTRYFRNPAIFRGYALLAVTALGLFGARQLAAVLRERDEERWRSLRWTAVGVAVLGLTVYFAASALLNVSTLTSFLDPRRTIGPAEARVHLAVSWLSIALVPLVCSLAGWRARTRLLPAALIAIAIASAWSTARIANPVIYGSESIRWRAIDFLYRDTIDLTAHGLTRVVDGDGNRTFYEKRPALKGYGPLQSAYVGVYEGDAALAATATGSERLWFAPVTISTVRSAPCLEAFRARVTALGSPPLVTHSPEAMRRASTDAETRACVSQVAAAAPAMRLPSADVRVMHYEPTRLTLRVTAPATGWLMVTDTWAGGWRATVNGAAVIVSGANFVFRAVPVTSGANEIDFRYEAMGYPWLLIGSWSTLAIVAGWSCAAALRRRAGPAPVTRSSAAPASARL